MNSQLEGHIENPMVRDKDVMLFIKKFGEILTVQESILQGMENSLA